MIMRHDVWSTLPKEELMTFRVAVAGASGYAGGEVLRLLLGHPAGQHRRGDRAQQRRRPARRAPAAPAAAGRPGPRDDHRRGSGRPRRGHSSPCRTGSRTSVAAQLGRGHRGHRLRRRPPARRPGRLAAVLRRRASRHLALRHARAARAPGTGSRGTRRVAVPGCYPTAASLALAPALAAGLVRAGGGGGRRVRHLRRGQGRPRPTCSAPR